MKLCRDCRFYQESLNPSQCLAPSNACAPDFVNGTTTPAYQYRAAQVVRMDNKLCGPDARWFELKIVERVA